MKYVLLLLFLGVTTSLSSQNPDYQWFVTELGLIEKASPNMINSSYNPKTPGADLFIEEVKHPRPAFGIPLVEPRNDFFIIYSNGSYFNSYDIPLLWVTQDGEYNGSSPNSNYKIDISNGPDIEYLYFTNVYDGDDDPNALVTNTPSYNQGQYLEPDFASLNSMMSNDPFSFNHTIVKGRDVTFILNKQAIQDSIKTCTSFDFCWTVPAGLSFQLQESDVFGAASTNLDFTHGFSSPPQLNGYCVRNIQLSAISGNYAFLNFRAPNVIPSQLIGEDITFALNCNNGVSWSRTIEVDDAHDPNLIDALCLREGQGHYFVEYEFLCTNEMGGSPSVSLSLIKPSNFLSLIPSSCTINGNQINVNLININSSANNILLEFPTPLGNYNLGNIEPSSIRLKFCVKYSGVANYADPNFTHIDGNTTFSSMAGGIEDYQIMHHFNLCGDYDLYYENGYPQVTGDAPWCKRDVMAQSATTKFCNCRCGEKPPCRFPWFDCCLPKPSIVPSKELGFLFSLLAIGLIFGGYLLFRKKP